MRPDRWEWDPAAGPARVEKGLASTGLVWLRAPALVEDAERDPEGAAARLLAETPLVVERQPIRPVAEGRSFASGCMAAPFHTDSQMLLGVPPHLQVMACAHAALRGGESLFLDTWALLGRIERDDAALFEALFTVPRHQPFVFGDVRGPTVTRRGDSLVFTHTARPRPDDAVAAGLRAFVESSDVIEVPAADGDVVLIHNHRMLHGRRAFDGERRAFTRLLAWRRTPWPAPAAWLARAARVAGPLDQRVACALDRLRAGEGDEPLLALVRALLGGVPPGLLSVRAGVGEPEIYRWRDEALREAMDGPS